MFTPGQPADIRWGADTALLCLMIDRVDVERELAAMLGRPLSGPVEFSPAMDLGTGAGRVWRGLVELLVRDADRPDSPLRHPAAVRNLQNLMINTLLLGHPNNYLAALTAPAPKPGRQAIREAVDLLENHPDAPWTPAGLAARVSISLRSLHDGFRRAVGTTPMAYLRELRLTRARAELASGTARSVTEVAGRWGSSISAGSRRPTGNGSASRRPPRYAVSRRSPARRPRCRAGSTPRPDRTPATRSPPAGSRRPRRSRSCPCPRGRRRTPG
ncbi:hypothetical protein GCM10029964_054200 [Kibdelosporangium lantanae]